MRILYDGFIYRSQKTGGVNRYFAHLIDGLPPDVQPILTSDSRPEHNFPTHPRLRLLQWALRRPNRLMRRLQRLYFRAITRAVPFDVAHPTYYSLLTGQPLGAYRRPVVITVYDMIHEIFPTEMDPKGLAAAEKRQAIASAQAIICISENTRQDLLRLYPVPEENVHVIPLATDMNQSLSYGPEPVPEQPYFLYVGQRDGYKNFGTLAKAFARIALKRPDVSLCVVGPAFSGPEREQMAHWGVLNRINHYGYVCDTHLAKLYRCAAALVYPSLYEGFGLPILEAMACGGAVIACKSASIPEVAGAAALLFDVGKDDELTDALLLVLEDEAEHGRLVAKGLQRAMQFSWRNTVARTVSVYRSIKD